MLDLTSEWSADCWGSDDGRMAFGATGGLGDLHFDDALTSSLFFWVVADGGERRC